jgi:hypothetical protein
VVGVSALANEPKLTTLTIPPAMETRLKVPENWQDFERLCHQLWKHIWGDHNAQMFGRRGQDQNGADIWGQPLWRGGWAGVQCKDRDGQLGSILTAEEFTEACTKSTDFEPTLTEFTLATTTARDVNLQTLAGQMTQSEVFPFSVHVWSWDDIQEEIRCRPELRDRFYPGWTETYEDERKLRFSIFPQPDHLRAFFTRPAVERGVSRGLRDLLMPLIYELADNSFEYGHATKFEVVCHDREILLVEDGGAFDPWTELDPSKASIHSHLGSYTVATFLKHFRGQVTPKYERQGDENHLCLRFDRHLAELSSPTRMELPVNLALSPTRRSASQLAASIHIPADVQEVVINVVGNSPPSSSFEFIRVLLAKIPRSARLMVYVPRSPYLSEMESMFADSRLTVIVR